MGGKQIGVPYERQSRHRGSPKYTFRKLVYVALDGLISFSHMPLRIITVRGFTVSLLSFLVALFYLVKKFTFGVGVDCLTILVVGEFGRWAGIYRSVIECGQMRLILQVGRYQVYERVRSASAVSGALAR